MDRKWSEEQKKIIEELRGKNVLVAAAAGSGKTTVLVERIKRMVSLEKVPVKSLLVVTFTKAAAAEMKEKIRRALRNELKEASTKDPELAGYLRAQIRDLNSADISTFDSFALNVVRRYFFKTDLEPGFGVLDEPRKVLMIEDSLDILLDEEFSEMRPEFIRFMDKYCSDRKPDKIRSLVANTYKKIMSMPHPWEWMEEQVKMLSTSREDFKGSKLWKLMRDDIIKSLAFAMEEGKRAADYLRSSSLDEMADRLESGELEKFENAFLVAKSEEDPEAMLSRLQAVLDARSPSLTAKKEEKEYYEPIKETVTSQRDRAKAYIKGIKSDYLSVDLDRMIEEMNDTAPDLKEMIYLLKRFHQHFKAAKEEAKVIDFTDMEHYCLEILEDPEIAAEYKKKFSQIFIDEYQDTNLLQEAIVDLIKRDNNLFMVGDVKQSIYRFRLAEPKIFQDKYDSYSEGSIPLSEVVDLNKNFRSKDGIIRGVNEVFRDMMEGYDERAELHTGVSYDGPLINMPELKIIPLEEEEAEEEEKESSAESKETEDSLKDDSENASGEDLGDEELTYENMEKAEREAKYIARLVKEHIGRPYFDTESKKERSLEPRDIVILLRSVKGYAWIYSDALSAVGVERYTSESGGYFDTMEVEIFMNLLSVIDNRRRDVELISVLHSDIFGFSAEELGEIRRFTKKGSYADAVFRFCEKGWKGELKEKCLRAMGKIEEWRNASRVMPLPRFIWNVMNESGFYLVMGAMPGGAVRQANLRALVDRAEGFAKDRQASLYSFVKYVGELRKRQVATPEVKLIGEGDQVVRIMTIHKSKGLEFPMVILAGAGRNLRYSNRGQSLVFHRDIGIGMTYVNFEDHWYRNTLPQKIIFRKIKEEEEQEQERILYVALTRAKDYLYIVGTVNDLETYEVGRTLGRRGHKNFIDMVGNSMPYSKAKEEDDIPGADEGEALDLSLGEGNLISPPDPERAEAIERILSFKYDFDEERKRKSKYSVSELNALRDGAEEAATYERKLELSAPGFAREKRKLSAAERGTVYHSIMEYIDFGRAFSEGIPYIEEQAGVMVKEGIITQEELAAVDLEKIDSFFRSELGRRASAAAARGELYKERPFTLREKDGKEDILVQGIIDCYFKEDGKTVLLDYKSNYIKTSSLGDYSKLLETYRTQLDIYRKAIDASGDGPVTEVYLYLFAVGEAIKA